MITVRIPALGLSTGKGSFDMNHEELPGMFELTRAVANQQWPHTIDAQAWTAEWLKTVKEKPEIATDEGAMLAWFANAIMAGYDTGIMRSQVPKGSPDAS